MSIEPVSFSFLQYWAFYFVHTFDSAFIRCGTTGTTSRIIKGTNLLFERAQLYNRRERVKRTLLSSSSSEAIGGSPWALLSLSEEVAVVCGFTGSSAVVPTLNVCYGKMLGRLGPVGEDMSILPHWQACYEKHEGTHRSWPTLRSKPLSSRRSHLLN